ncbi:autoinducer binding domain-containing protein [Burkholderia sp. 1B3(2022)]|uniref:autoinducer binding domain-containing protein n=1 Tax=Burkholderia sp. 1B3(2022) TaxID=2997425 RepID=UPI003FA5D148
MKGLDCLKWLVPGDTDASWQRMTDAAAGMGFDKVVLIVLPFAGASFDLARKWSSGVPGWTALYRQRQFDRIDPMLQHCFRSALPLVWDGALFGLPEQRPCYEAAAAYGMRSGVVLPVRGPKGRSACCRARARTISPPRASAATGIWRRSRCCATSPAKRSPAHAATHRPTACRASAGGRSSACAGMRPARPRGKSATS